MKDFKSSMWAKTFVAVMTDAFPFSFTAFLAILGEKNSSQVSIPLFSAIRTMLLAGSIPKVVAPCFAKEPKSTPTLLPISTTKLPSPIP